MKAQVCPAFVKSTHHHSAINPRCKSFLAEKTKLVSSTFTRSVTLAKIEAISCAESPGYSPPEPESDATSDEEASESSPKRSTNSEVGVIIVFNPEMNRKVLNFNGATIEPKKSVHSKLKSTFIPSKDKTLSLLSGPPPNTEAAEQKKTLVLHLDETLIRAIDSERGKRENSTEVNTTIMIDQYGMITEQEFYLRPYARELLAALSPHYEIIVIL